MMHFIDKRTQGIQDKIVWLLQKQMRKGKDAVPMSEAQIAKELGTSKSTVSRNILKMVEAGVLTQYRSTMNVARTYVYHKPGTNPNDAPPKLKNLKIHNSSVIIKKKNSENPKPKRGFPKPVFFEQFPSPNTGYTSLPINGTQDGSYPYYLNTNKREELEPLPKPTNFDSYSQQPTASEPTASDATEKHQSNIGINTTGAVPAPVPHPGGREEGEQLSRTGKFHGHRATPPPLCGAPPRPNGPDANGISFSEALERLAMLEAEIGKLREIVAAGVWQAAQPEPVVEVTAKEPKARKEGKKMGFASREVTEAKRRFINRWNGWQKQARLDGKLSNGGDGGSVLRFIDDFGVEGSMEKLERFLDFCAERSRQPKHGMGLLWTMARNGDLDDDAQLGPDEENTELSWRLIDNKHNFEDTTAINPKIIPTESSMPVGEAQPESVSVFNNTITGCTGAVLDIEAGPGCIFEGNTITDGVYCLDAEVRKIEPKPASGPDKELVFHARVEPHKPTAPVNALQRAGVSATSAKPAQRPASAAKPGSASAQATPDELKVQSEWNSKVTNKKCWDWTKDVSDSFSKVRDNPVFQQAWPELVEKCAGIAKHEKCHWMSIYFAFNNWGTIMNGKYDWAIGSVQEAAAQPKYGHPGEYGPRHVEVEQFWDSQSCRPIEALEPINARVVATTWICYRVWSNMGGLPHRWEEARKLVGLATSSKARPEDIEQFTALSGMTLDEVEAVKSDMQQKVERFPERVAFFENRTKVAPWQ